MAGHGLVRRGGVRLGMAGQRLGSMKLVKGNTHEGQE